MEITNKLRMPASRDPETQILVCQALMVHVKCKKRNFNPVDPRLYWDKEIIAVYSPEEFQGMEKLANGPYHINWCTAAGFDEARVIHLPEDVSDELRGEINAYWEALKRPKQDTESIEVLKNRIKKLETINRSKKLSL